MIAIMSDTLEPLFADAPTRAFVAGEALFRVGDRVASMFLLHSGNADLIRHTGDGLRMILHRAGPGQILAEASAWSDIYHCNALATEFCSTAILPRQIFQARLQAAPRIAEYWTRGLARGPDRPAASRDPVAVEGGRPALCLAWRGQPAAPKRGVGRKWPPNLHSERRAPLQAPAESADERHPRYCCDCAR
jgi:hypothetical protein